MVILNVVIANAFEAMDAASRAAVGRTNKTGCREFRRSVKSALVDHVPEIGDVDGLSLADAAGARLTTLTLSERAAADVGSAMKALAARGLGCLATVKTVRVIGPILTVKRTDVGTVLMACPGTRDLVVDCSGTVSFRTDALAAIERTVVRCKNVKGADEARPAAIPYPSISALRIIEQAAMRDGCVELGINSGDVCMTFDRGRLTEWDCPRASNGATALPEMPSIAVLPRTWLRRLEMKEITFHVLTLSSLLSESPALESVAIKAVADPPVFRAHQPLTPTQIHDSLRTISLVGRHQDAHGLTAIHRMLFGARTQLLLHPDLSLEMDGVSESTLFDAMTAVRRRRPGSPIRLSLAWRIPTSQFGHTAAAELRMASALAASYPSGVDSVRLVGWECVDAEVTGRMIEAIVPGGALIIDPFTCRLPLSASGCGTPVAYLMALGRLMTVAQDPIGGADVYITLPAGTGPPAHTQQPVVDDTDDHASVDDHASHASVDCRVMLWQSLSRRIRLHRGSGDAAASAVAEVCADMVAKKLAAGPSDDTDAPALHHEEFRSLKADKISAALAFAIRAIKEIAKRGCSSASEGCEPPPSPLLLSVLCDDIADSVRRWAFNSMDSLSDVDYIAFAEDAAGKCSASVIASSQRVAAVLDGIRSSMLLPGGLASSERLGVIIGSKVTKALVICASVYCGPGLRRARTACSVYMARIISSAIRVGEDSTCVELVSGFPLNLLLAMRQGLPSVSPFMPITVSPFGSISEKPDSYELARRCGEDAAAATMASLNDRNPTKRLEQCYRTVGTMMISSVISDAIAAHASQYIASTGKSSMLAQSYAISFGTSMVESILHRHACRDQYHYCPPPVQSDVTN